MKMFALSHEEAAVIKAFRQLTPRQRLLLLSAMIYAAHDDGVAEMAWMIDNVINLHRSKQD